MDFRLKVFEVVASHLSFTKASGVLGISQPAVTKHIQELESLYRIQLFDRTGGKISLTHQGQLFLEHTKKIVAAYKELSREMELLSGEYSGELRIGATSIIAQYLLPYLVAGFMRRFPKVKISLVTGCANELEKALESNIIDLGIMEMGIMAPNLKYGYFKRETLFLVTSKDTLGPDSITVGNLLSLPVVMSGNDSGLSDLIERNLQEIGLHKSDLNILIELDTVEAVKRFISAKDGSYAILPSMSIEEEVKSNRFKVISVENMNFAGDVVFVSRQEENNAILQKFVSFALSGS